MAQGRIDDRIRCRVSRSRAGLVEKQRLEGCEIPPTERYDALCRRMADNDLRS